MGSEHTHLRRTGRLESLEALCDVGHYLRPDMVDDARQQERTLIQKARNGFLDRVLKSDKKA